MWIQKLITTTLFIGHLFNLLIYPFLYEDEGENVDPKVDDNNLIYNVSIH